MDSGRRVEGGRGSLKSRERITGGGGGNPQITRNRNTTNATTQQNGPVGGELRLSNATGIMCRERVKLLNPIGNP